LEGNLNPSDKKPLMTDAFEAACPLFMSYGMTYDEFWHDDPVRAKYYREAHEIVLEQMSFNAFVQGRYVRDAIADFIEFYAMTSRPKVGKHYPEKPYPITDRAKRIAEEHREEEVANRYLKMLGAKRNGNND